MHTEASSNEGAEPGRGGWFETALSIATTIGKVAGALSGAGDEGYVDFGATGRGKYPMLGSLGFVNEGGGIMAVNTDLEDPITLFFPSDTDSSPPGESVTIKPSEKLSVSPIFQTYAELDSFSITPWAQVKEGEGGKADGAATIRVSTTEPVRSGVEVSLGSFFKLNLSTSDRNLTVMTAAGFVLASIVLLNVRGSRATVAQLFSIVKRGDAAADPGPAVLKIPLGVDLEDGLHMVELVAEIEGLQAAVERQEQEGIHVGRPLSEEDHARLERINANR